MALLGFRQGVPLTKFDKIGTIQRRLPRSSNLKSGNARMMQRKRYVPLKTSDKIGTIQRRLPRSNPHPLNDQLKEDMLFVENPDEWMKESMTDIVKNLKKAPLMVQIYAHKDDRGQERRRPLIKTERALLEKWPILKNEWENGEKITPDGLIYVEELDEEDENSRTFDEDDKDLTNLDEDFEEGLTKSWGIVVQGKGIEYGPACYLLKTSRVRAGRGMDLFATHFCLVRVKNFRESSLRQFKGSWLL